MQLQSQYSHQSKGSRCPVQGDAQQNGIGVVMGVRLLGFGQHTPFKKSVYTQSGQQHQSRNLVMMVAMGMLMAMRMRQVTVFHSGSEILKKLLEEKTCQHKQADEFNAFMMPVQFRKDVYHSNAEEVSARKHQQESETSVCAVG
jgi:hypothetical protein